MRLTASPVCPAPMTTVVTRSMGKETMLTRWRISVFLWTSTETFVGFVTMS